MKDNAAWLFLEPHVHLIRQDGVLLFYNTLSKTVLEFDASPAIRKLATDLLNPANGYVVALSHKQLDKPEIRGFIERLRHDFLGDLLDASWSLGKPVNIVPEPFVRHGFSRPTTTPSAFSPELDARNYIHELTLYLNSAELPVPTPFSTAWRQFSFPGCTTGKPGEMDLRLVRTLIDDVNQYTPTLIHLSGMNILHYQSLPEVVGILGKSPFQKKYHLRLADWDHHILPFLVNQKQTTIALYITFPTEPETVAGYLRTLPDLKLMKKLEFNLVVGNPEELQMALELVNTLDLTNIFFKPLFTGENLDFFREQVFVSREEILAARPDQQQVLSRISVNEHDFGKLSILPDGEVYANLNDPMVGDATTSTLMQLVISELDNGVSWRRSRKEVSPCAACRYQFLCPPVSSYEIFMNRYHFCHVYPNGEEV
ncbi:MAG: TIGR04150 pseudo-rSAM protein [Bacteroidetes bacterium]|nr:MAG: TIGR04150 pseudo-rSAM protein [Bacteroidota bacterium]